MSRVLLPLWTLFSLCGCGHFRNQTADYACDDCVPPPVAGRYKYHRPIDNFLTTLTAQKCAHRDLKQFKEACGPLSRDYKDGYTQAYIDLAAGRPACVPAVPPPKYWHAWHRSSAARHEVEEWYAGYRNGLDNGVNGAVNDFNRIVPSSDGCCVSAAYVSPYATATHPQIVQPLHGQTLTQFPQEAPSPVSAPQSGEVFPVGLQSSDNSPGIPGASELPLELPPPSIAP